jgi:dihydrolipoamide dehydrogenase
VSKGRIAVITLLLALIILFIVTDAANLISLEGFKQRQVDIQVFVSDNPLLSAGGYLAIYILVAALSIPGAAALTLIGGALFGLLQGTLLVSFASTIGASGAFLVSRYLLRNSVEQRFGSAGKKINKGIAKDGSFYLFGLRLVPLFPFFVINLVMGLTRLPLRKFFWVSQLGMLPGTIVFVNAGTQLGELDNVSGILSPEIIGSFVLLGLFPLIARKVLQLWQQQRVFQGHKKPKTFDTNLIVIGAGAAGLVTAYVAAASKARVLLIEREKMGGDCLNTGCVPSKALIRSAGVMHDIRRAADFGIQHNPASIDFPAVMRRVQSVIESIEPHDSIDRYEGLGVDCITGHATITSPWTVEVDGHTHSARSIVIATGGKPFVPQIEGLDAVDYLTSDTLWQLPELPKELLILGGGFIGCELAQAFQRLGSKVTLVEAGDRLLTAEDADVSAAISSSFESEGIKLVTGYRAQKVQQGVAHCVSDDGSHKELRFDKLLIATGRIANTEGLGLENIGLETNQDGTLAVNDCLQTRYPNIYACGDVTGPFQLTHAAAHQAWYCAVNALFGSFHKFKVDCRVMPRGVFTSPEIARVGLNEQEAIKAHVAYETTVYGIDDLDRAIADGDASGFIKVLTPPGKDTILGVTIVGKHATELLAEFTLAMRHGLGLRKILATVHPYPTYGEAAKFAAGLWQQRHLPQRLLAVAERYNRWRRS